jgi:hypothetical protein
MSYSVLNLVPQVTKFCQQLSMQKPVAYRIYDLDESGPSIIPDGQQTFMYDKQTDQFYLYSNNVKSMAGGLPKASVLRAADAIQKYSRSSKHRRIVDDATWLNLYGLTPKAMPCKFGPNWDSILVNVLPCFYCGQALPIRLMEVDHWYEQKNNDGTGSAQALLKVFRALGLSLTSAGSTGKKGLQFVSIMSGQGVNTVATRGIKSNATIKLARVNTLRMDFNHGKRQLSTDGLMMLSILLRATGLVNQQASFFKIFVNHFLNLVPCCPCCNKLKNDRMQDQPNSVQSDW